MDDSEHPGIWRSGQACARTRRACFVARRLELATVDALQRGVFKATYILLFPPRLLSSAFFLSETLLVATQIRGHIAGSSPPVPTTVRAWHFLSREDFSSFLPSSTRVELCLPTLGALSNCWPFS